MRVYELAKELDVESKVVIEALNSVGVPVTSHANSVSDEEAAKAREALTGDGGEVEEKAEEKAEEVAEAAPETEVVEGDIEEKAEAPAEETGTAAAEQLAEADEALPEPEEADVDAAAHAPAPPEEEEDVVLIEDGMTVKSFAEAIGVKPADVIRELMSRGVMANVNQALDADVATEIADARGIATRVRHEDEELIGEIDAGSAEDLETRAPVVTIMGHVDHGKTQLLDSIRETDVVAGEAGGITQHIGASEVEWDGNRIVFIDTPGHEAFTRMRARGADITDIVVLVIAADDGVMPQTAEAIDHAKAADVPIIVAINKMDKPEANPDRVKQQLLEHELTPEDWGGDTVCVPVSAITKDNLDELLEMIVLTAELLELQANPEISARGVVLEAELDRRRGAVATLLVREGTLEVGDDLVAGSENARVRAMVNSRGNQVKEAGPATAVEVLGFSGVPQAGDAFQVVEESTTARKVSEIRQERERQDSLSAGTRLTLQDLHERMREGEQVTLPIVLKADTQGSVETLRDALTKLSGDKVEVEIMHAGVGGVSENDVLLASASDALIVGFNIRPEKGAADAADREDVELRLYTVIYQLIDDVKQAMVGKLEPTYEEESLGQAEVRDTFQVPRAGTVAGCYVTDGKIARNAKARLVRDSRIVWEGEIGSLRRFKDDVREVQQGYECGIGLENFNDVKIGDVIEAYEMRELAPELS